MGKYIWILLIIFILSCFHMLLAQEECTIGAASGMGTSDGRPLIWKTRDNSAERDNELVYNTSYSIPFLEIINAGKTSAWMGLNRAGFALLNTVCEDLATTGSGLSNGVLMRNALGKCASIKEFETFLDQNDHGNTHGNFATLDSSGAAAIFEINGYEYWKYSANDSVQAPYGYLVRTNFAANGNGLDGSGYERFNRSADLMYDFYSGDSLNFRSILRHQMRDFSDTHSQPLPVPFPDRWVSYRPYGYIYTDVSICRASSVSATAIQGILPGESELLSTMWTMLGSPAAAITVPYWPVGNTPAEANGTPTAPLCDISLQLRAELFDYPENTSYINSYKLLDGKGSGAWITLFAAEDSIIRGGQNWQQKWRAEGVDIPEMLTVQKNYAGYAYQNTALAFTRLTTALGGQQPKPVMDFSLAQNFPNPFNGGTEIRLNLSAPGWVSLSVYDILGRFVQNIANEQMSAGAHKLHWEANPELPSGIYFYKLYLSVNGSKKTIIKKMNYLK